MKYLDFSSLFEGEPAYIAFLSTFQFDPDFFERRLSSPPPLRKARRIIIFIDALRSSFLMQLDFSAI